MLRPPVTQQGRPRSKADTPTASSQGSPRIAKCHHTKITDRPATPPGGRGGGAIATSTGIDVTGTVARALAPQAHLDQGQGHNGQDTKCHSTRLITAHNGLPYLADHIGAPPHEYDQLAVNATGPITAHDAAKWGGNQNTQPKPHRADPLYSPTPAHGQLTDPCHQLIGRRVPPHHYATGSRDGAYMTSDLPHDHATNVVGVCMERDCTPGGQPQDVCPRNEAKRGTPTNRRSGSNINTATYDNQVDWANDEELGEGQVQKIAYQTKRKPPRRSGSLNLTATGETHTPVALDMPEFMRRVQYPHLPGDDTASPQEEDGGHHDMDGVQYAPEEHIGDQLPDYKKWPYPTMSMASGTASIYEQALAARLGGRTPPRVDQDTTLKIQAWRNAATGHQQDELVIQGIAHGFPVQYRGPPRLGDTPRYNHATAVNHADHIQEYIMKETDCHALEGPFREPPFTPWFHASPLMTREKGDGAGRRIIVDLSYPEGGINRYIPQHLYNEQEAVHRLPTIESAIKTLSTMCPGDIHLAVIDLSRAYRHFPVDPLDWPLLGIHWRDRWAFDRRLPFGSRMSSFVMQVIADFIVRHLSANRIITHMYLDDIIILSPTRQLALTQYNRVIGSLEALGLQVAVKKLQPPSPRVKWLGIIIDVENNRLSIPAEKLVQIKTCMANASRLKTLTRKHLQRLVGLANHLAKVVRAARIFVCRLLAALRAAPTDHILVTRHVRSDLAWFVRYLQEANGRAIIPHRCVVIRIWADACLVGGGASDGKQYYEYVFPTKVTATHHITQLEALNCVAAVRTFVGPTHAGGTVQVFCDNQPSVDALTSGRAKDNVLAACARALWLHAAQTDTDIEFTHAPGEGMALPDALSRASLADNSRKEADRLIKNLSLVKVHVDNKAYSYSSFI